MDNALFWPEIALLDHGLRAFFLTGNSMTLVASEKQVSWFSSFFITKGFTLLSLKLNYKIVASYINKREQSKYNVQETELK